MSNKEIKHRDALKVLLAELDVGELRAVEDYAQRLRLRLQDENLKKMASE